MDEQRYSRQVLLNGFGNAGQRKLVQASVLVIGAGGLGCPALQYLAAAGVGRIGIMDGDVVSLSNLHRQILYSAEDVDSLKVDIASAYLLRLNPEVIIEPYPVYLTKLNILETFVNYDIIIDGSDNFLTRYLINDACVLLNKPLIFAAVSGYEAQIAIFNVEDASGIKTNYRDLFPDVPGKWEIPNCAETGVIGVLPGIIGTMQAAEAIKLITGIGDTLANRLLNYNLLYQSFYEIRLSPAEQDDYSSTYFSASCFNSRDEQKDIVKDDLIAEISFNELQEIGKNGSSVFIDVREINETPRLNVFAFKSFPMSDLGKLLETEIPERNIILLCQQGLRSRTVAGFLKEKYGKNKNIFSLRGGILRWGNSLNQIYERKEI